MRAQDIEEPKSNPRRLCPCPQRGRGYQAAPTLAGPATPLRVSLAIHRCSPMSFKSVTGMESLPGAPGTYSPGFFVL